MIEPQPTPNEEERLKDLYSLEILDTVIERSYDQLTKLAAKICQVPISLVSLVDKDRQWFKSKVGLDAAETSRKVSFCGHAIHSDKPFIVEDATKDERFSNNPLVTGESPVIFYAGIPIGIERGKNIGTLCVIDHQPKSLSPGQLEALTIVADQVKSLLVLRKRSKELEYLSAQNSIIVQMIHSEMKTPLNSIMTTSKMIRDLSRETEISKMADSVEKASKRLSRIILEALELTDIGAGSQIVKSEMVDTSDFFRDCIDMFKPVVAAKNIEIDLQLNGDLPRFIVIDEYRTGQIINHLVDSAIKFTDKGKVQIRVSTKDSKGSKSTLIVEVEDSGAGLSDTQVAKLFKPPMEQKDSIKRVFGGTSIGFAISKTNIDLMRGRIGCRSQIGKGTTFRVEIPVILSDTKKRIDSHELEKVNLKILVAEDNQVMRFIARNILSKLGCQVTLVENGLQAFEAMSQEKFDVCFMDCSMPIMDGYTATARAHAELPPGQVPYIVALTANDSDADKKKCKKSGMKGFIPKPVTKDLLLEFFDIYEKNIA